jgi:hypothetical protein
LLGCLERQEKKLVSLLIVSDVFFNLYYTPEDDDYLFGYIGLLSLFTLEWSKKVYDDQMHYIRTNWGAYNTFLLALAFLHVGLVLAGLPWASIEAALMYGRGFRLIHCAEGFGLPQLEKPILLALPLVVLIFLAVALFGIVASRIANMEDIDGFDHFATGPLRQAIVFTVIWADLIDPTASGFAFFIVVAHAGLVYLILVPLLFGVLSGGGSGADQAEGGPKLRGKGGQKAGPAFERKKPGMGASGATFEEKIIEFVENGLLPLTKSTFNDRLSKPENEQIWLEICPSWPEEEREDVEDFLNFPDEGIELQEFILRIQQFKEGATYRHVLRIDELAIETYKRVYKIERYMGSLVHVLSRRIKKERAKVLRKRKLRELTGEADSSDEEVSDDGELRGGSRVVRGTTRQSSGSGPSRSGSKRQSTGDVSRSGTRKSVQKSSKESKVSVGGSVLAGVAAAKFKSKGSKGSSKA